MSFVDSQQQNTGAQNATGRNSQRRSSKDLTDLAKDFGAALSGGFKTADTDHDGTLSGAEWQQSGLDDKLDELLKGSPLETQFKQLASQLQTGGWNELEGDLVADLIALSNEPAGAENIDVMREMVDLAIDFSGPSNQPTGLTQTHADGLKKLTDLLKDSKNSPEQVSNWVKDLKGYALEGAHLFDGAFTGLAQADVGKLGTESIIPPLSAEAKLQAAAQLIMKDGRALDVAYQGYAPNRAGLGDDVVSWQDLQARKADPSIDPKVKRGLGQITREMFDTLCQGKKMISLPDLAAKYGMEMSDSTSVDAARLRAAAKTIVSDAAALDTAGRPNGQGKKDGQIAATDLLARIDDRKIDPKLKAALEAITPEVWDALRGDDGLISVKDIETRFLGAGSADLKAAATLINSDGKALDIANKNYAPNAKGVGDTVVSWGDIQARIADPSTPANVKSGLQKISKEVFDTLCQGEKMISLPALAKHFGLEQPAAVKPGKPQPDKGDDKPQANKQPSDSAPAKGQDSNDLGDLAREFGAALRDRFDSADKNDDGALSRAEWRNADLGSDLGTYRHTDASGKGGVSWKEFAQGYQNLSAEEAGADLPPPVQKPAVIPTNSEMLQQIKEHRTEMDGNKDGVLSVDEYVQWRDKNDMNSKAIHAEAMGMVAAYGVYADSNSDGQMSMEEFLSMRSDSGTSSTSALPDYEAIRADLTKYGKALDHDKDGVISVDDYIAWRADNKQGGQAIRNDAFALLSTIGAYSDLNGDSQLGLEEYLSLRGG